MKLSEMFPRRWMVGADLGGKEYTLKIDRVAQEQIQVQGGKKEPRYVLYFKGAKKGLILNRTIGEQIAGVVSSEETDDWRGQAVTIYPVEMRVAGEQRVGIRVRKPVGGAAAASHTEALDHEEEEDATAAVADGERMSK